MARPSQAQIYRRRRLLFLVVMAVVAALIWFGTSAIAQFGQTSQLESTAGSGPETQSTLAPDDYPNCNPAQIELVAQVGDENGPRDSFGADALPSLWYEIVSTADTPCTFNVGSSVTFFTITSGDETIWSSRQCDRSGDADLVALLEPGIGKRSQPSEWLRVRSSQAGGCGAGQPEVVAGGASYHLRVEVNGVISQNKQQFLLY